MINVLLLEDELPAQKKIIRFLNEVPETVNIVAQIDTVDQGIAFLKNTTVDIIFSDIELLDGKAFEIFEQVTVSCPIIFTTAYDQFWVNAFETNGIDYLLKPFSLERFQKAWNKFLLLKKSDVTTQELVVKLNKLIESNTSKNYKTRFSITTNKAIYFLEIITITYFEAEESVVFAHDSLGKKHLMNEGTLKEIENQVNPNDFFRINRSELVHKKYINQIERYSKNAYAIKLKGVEKHLITSQSNSAAFRAWID